MLKRTNRGAILYDGLCTLRYNPCYIEQYYLVRQDYGLGYVTIDLVNGHNYGHMYKGDNRVSVLKACIFMDSFLSGLRAALNAPKSREANIALRDCAEQMVLDYLVNACPFQVQTCQA